MGLFDFFYKFKKIDDKTKLNHIPKALTSWYRISTYFQNVLSYDSPSFEEVNERLKNL